MASAASAHSMSSSPSPQSEPFSSSSFSPFTSSSLALYRHIHPEQFYHSFLQHSIAAASSSSSSSSSLPIRPNGRSFFSSRPLSLSPCSLLPSLSSSLCSLGRTTVLCSLQLEIIEPTAEGPEKGKISVEVTRGPGATREAERGEGGEKKGREALASLASFLQRLFSSGVPFPLSQLSIEPSVSAFLIRADLLLLSDEGNVLDCCVAALSHSLRRLPLPPVHIDEEKRVWIREVKEGEEGEGMGLMMQWAPLAVSFVLLQEGEEDKGLLLLDPDEEEERRAGGERVTVLFAAAVDGEKREGPSSSSPFFAAAAAVGRERRAFGLFPHRGNAMDGEVGPMKFMGVEKTWGSQGLSSELMATAMREGRKRAREMAKIIAPL